MSASYFWCDQCGSRHRYFHKVVLHYQRHHPAIYILHEQRKRLGKSAPYTSRLWVRKERS